MVFRLDSKGPKKSKSDRSRQEVPYSNEYLVPKFYSVFSENASSTVCQKEVTLWLKNADVRRSLEMGSKSVLRR